MDNAGLKVKLREGTKKGAARKLRSEGLLPGILYGNKSESTKIAVPARDLSNLIAHGGLHSIIGLSIEDGDKKKSSAIIKEVQKDPVRGDLLHVDFLKINLNQEMDSSLPINIIGDSAGVHAGGVVQHGAREITVRAIAKDMPDHIDVDITALEIGDALRVGDVVVPEGMTILSNPEDVICSVVMPAKAAEEIPVTEAEEPELVGEKKAEEAPEGE